MSFTHTPAPPQKKSTKPINLKVFVQYCIARNCFQIQMKEKNDENPKYIIVSLKTLHSK